MSSPDEIHVYIIYDDGKIARQVHSVLSVNNSLIIEGIIVKSPMKFNIVKNIIDSKETNELHSYESLTFRYIYTKTNENQRREDVINLLSKRYDEIKCLIKDRDELNKQVIDDSLSDEEIKNINKELELTNDKIRNHNKEINMTKKSISEEGINVTDEISHYDTTLKQNEIGHINDLPEQTKGFMIFWYPVNYYNIIKPSIENNERTIEFSYD